MSVLGYVWFLLSQLPSLLLYFPNTEFQGRYNRQHAVLLVYNTFMKEHDPRQRESKPQQSDLRPLRRSVAFQTVPVAFIGLSTIKTNMSMESPSALGALVGTMVTLCAGLAHIHLSTKKGNK